MAAYQPVVLTCVHCVHYPTSTISAGDRPVTAHLLRSWVRIPPGAWIFICCECRVLSGRGLCNKLITRPEESHQLWCFIVCDLETSRIGAPYIYIYIYDISSLRVNKEIFISRMHGANIKKNQPSTLTGFFKCNFLKYPTLNSSHIESTPK